MKYVGLTMRPFLERKYEHLRKASSAGTSSSPFKVAIWGYGVENFDDNFESEILEDGLTEIEVYQREVYWIKELNTFWYDKDEFGNPCGYNATRGGDGASWGLGKPVIGINVETFEVTRYHLAREASEDLCCSVGSINGACNGGGARQTFGYCWLYESEYKAILESDIWTPQDYVMFQLNFIIQIAEDDSVVAYHRYTTDAAIAVDGDSSMISDYCNGDMQKTVYKGYRWQYYRDHKVHGIRELRDGKLREVVKVSQEGVVVETFANARQAADTVGLFSIAVWESCNGKRISPLPDGFYYRYKDVFEVSGLIIREVTSRAIDKVLQFKDGILLAEFKSLSAAARKIGVEQSAIGYCCVHKRRSLLKGCWYMYKTDFEFGGYVGPVAITTKSVVKTNIDGNFLGRYETRAEAGDSNGINRSTVSKSCHGERKSPFFDKGIHFWFFNESDYYRAIFYTSDGVQTAFKTLGAAAIQTATPIRDVFLSCLGKVSERHFYFLDSIGLSEEQYEEIVSNFVEDEETEDFSEEIEDFPDETEEVKDILENFTEVVQEVQEIKQMGLF